MPMTEMTCFNVLVRDTDQGPALVLPDLYQLIGKRLTVKVWVREARRAQGTGVPTPGSPKDPEARR